MGYCTWPKFLNLSRWIGPAFQKWTMNDSTHTRALFPTYCFPELNHDTNPYPSFSAVSKIFVQTEHLASPLLTKIKEPARCCTWTKIFETVENTVIDGGWYHGSALGNNAQVWVLSWFSFGNLAVRSGTHSSPLGYTTFGSSQGQNFTEWSLILDEKWSWQITNTTKNWHPD